MLPPRMRNESAHVVRFFATKCSVKEGVLGGFWGVQRGLEVEVGF